MRSVAQRLTKTGDNHRMQSSTHYSLSLPPSLDLFLCLVLFADWISAPFSLTLDLLSLQSHPTHSPTSKPILPVQSHFLSYRFLESDTLSLLQEKTCSFFFIWIIGWGGMYVIDSHIYVTLTSTVAPACLPVRLATELPNAFGCFYCFTRQASAPNYPERTALMLDFKAS